ncbi:hypothetical protein KUV89_05805 [Marinobacter hydrocarbonoclasticus]|nr:hypothetical protein [Marinobacter nauticus]
MTRQQLMAVLPAMVLAGCASNATIKYPPQTQQQAEIDNRQSTAYVAKAATEFRDRDIVVPAYFDTQGLELCTFDPANESDGCPLKKPVLRVYFDGNQVQGKSELAEALHSLDNLNLSKMFENQVVGLNRFRIVTRDQSAVDVELDTQLRDGGASAVIARRMEQAPLLPDYLLKIDTLKTADTFYAEYNGMAQYGLELTSAVLNPMTKEKLSHPNVGKVRVRGTDVRAKSELVFTEVSGRYYTGFDYTNPDNVRAVMNDMASRGFDIMITRLLSEMPATAQVQGFKGNQVTLDRGQNAGILPNETMVLFQYEAGFVEPIGIATMTPSSLSAYGTVVRWKDNDLADGIRRNAKGQIYRPDPAVRIFAVSVGTPPDFLDKRM